MSYVKARSRCSAMTRVCSAGGRSGLSAVTCCTASSARLKCTSASWGAYRARALDPCIAVRSSMPWPTGLHRKHGKPAQRSALSSMSPLRRSRMSTSVDALPAPVPQVLIDGMPGQRAEKANCSASLSTTSCAAISSLIRVQQGAGLPPRQRFQKRIVSAGPQRLPARATGALPAQSRRAPPDCCLYVSAERARPRRIYAPNDHREKDVACDDERFAPLR